MIFSSDRPDLRVRASRLGRTIEFVNGRYETDDPAEIAVLERNRYVRAGEPVGAPDPVVAEALDEIEDVDPEGDDADNPAAD